MKTVKEIRDFNDKYRYMAINAQNTQNLNQFVFDVLIGITEYLEAQAAQNQGPGATFIRRDGSMFAMARAGTEEEHAEFLRSGAVPSDAIPVVVSGVPRETQQEAVDAIRVVARREGMVEALRWADRVTQSGGVEYSAIGKAIARLENGGDL